MMVRSDTPLDRLHHILQLAMAWSDGHLHEFVANGVAYGTADEEWSDDVEDERHAYLADVASLAGDRLLYRYDFGDGWECDLVIERRAYLADVATLAGDRLLYRYDFGDGWECGDFDPEEFDRARVNALLREFAHDHTLVDDLR